MSIPNDCTENMMMSIEKVHGSMYAVIKDCELMETIIGDCHGEAEVHQSPSLD